MSKINVAKAQLSKFLKLCEMTGSHKTNEELAITITQNEIFAWVVSPYKNYVAFSSIPGKFADWGEIGAKIAPHLNKFLSTRSNAFDVSLQKIEDTLYCECGDTTLISPLCDLQYMLNRPDQTKIQRIFDEAQKGPSLSLKRGDLKRIIASAKLVRARSISLSGKDEIITFKFNGLKKSCVLDFKASNKIEIAFEVKFNETFLKTLTSLMNYDLSLFIDVSRRIIYLNINSREIRFECALTGHS